MDNELDEEFSRMIATVDISTREKLAAFKKWQYEDGTKEGLRKLMQHGQASGASNLHERCRISAECLPESDYRARLEVLHSEMLREIDLLRALVRDVDANARGAWADRTLSAKAWPTELARRVADEVERMK